MSSQSFKSISPNVLAMCETNLERSIDYSIFSVRHYLSLIRNDFVTHIYDVAVSMKKGLLFGFYLSLEKSEGSDFCFRLALLHSVLHLFFLYRSLSSTMCKISGAMLSIRLSY